MYADVDLNGFWMASSFSSPQCVEIVQVGTALTLRFCDIPGSDFTGTIDPMTGAFTVSKPVSCSSGGDCGTIDATAALDSSSWSGTLHCLVAVFPGPCVPFDNPITATRVVCGDGIQISGAGEGCDDGNTQAGDCCSPTCQVDPLGTACDDGDPGTTGEQCVAGQCTFLGDEFVVNTYTTSGQAQPSITCAGDGSFVVVWAGIYAANGVSGRRYDSGGSALGPQFEIATSGIARYPSVASNATGDFIVAWTNTLSPPFGVPQGIFVRRYDSAGAPLGTEMEVETYATADGLRPDVSLNGDGRFVVVWTGAGQDGSAEGIFGRRFDSAGTALGTEFLINTTTVGSQRFPAVSLDDNGDFVVVWSGDSDGDSSGVFARRYDSAGIALSSELVVNSTTVAFQGLPDVTLDGSGRRIVVWTDGLNIRGQRFTGTMSPLGTEFQANTTSPTVGTGMRPAVAARADGSFVIVWHDPATDDILGRRYDTNALPDGGEFAVNVFTPFAQRDPDVCNSDSSFVAVWTSTNEDGDGQGVAARRFPLTTPTPTPTPALDHYKCYQGRDLKQPSFASLSVATGDQLTTETVTVNRVKFVCVPVDKNGEGITAPGAHLVCYLVEGAALAPRPHVQLSSQFQASRFELKRPTLLCVPATKTILP